jgi:hypothetical protein
MFKTCACLFVAVLLVAVLVGVALERSPIDRSVAVDVSANVLSTDSRSDVDSTLGDRVRRAQCGVVGGESFVELRAFNDSIFTGTADGRLLQLPRNADDLLACRGVRTVLYVGDALSHDAVRFNYQAHCGAPQFERICGRLLGLRPHPEHDDTIIAMDASFGLLFIHVPSATVQVIANHDPAVPKDTFLFSNDLAVVGRHVYFTVTSTRFERTRVMLEILEASCTGRLMRLDLGPNTVRVLANGLCFPNGVEQRDTTSLIFVELARARIMRFDVPSGTLSKFADLPGHADNIRRSQQFPDEFWIGYATKFDKLTPLVYGSPLLRRLLVGLLALISSRPEVDILRLLPRPQSMIERRSLVDGRVTARFHDVTGGGDAGDEPLAFFSEVHELNATTALIGSYRNDFVAVLRV